MFGVDMCHLMLLDNSAQIKHTIEVMTQLNTVGARLQAGLIRAQQQTELRQKALRQSDTVNVVGAGGMLTAAYEQLRKATENTEEHLLLQNAIRRFFKQLFIVRDESLIRKSGEELIVELTFAGYIPNDSITRIQATEI